MEFDRIKYVYFLGIGGIGMSALARFFNASGKRVAGYDKTPTQLTDELVSENISIHFDDDVNKIPPGFKDKNEKENCMVVVTPAVPADHSELQWFKQNNYRIAKRSEVLGIITKQSYTIAVAGTHGKTTTSSIITHLLRHSGIECNAFLGGIAKNYNSNVLISDKVYKDNKPIVVVEADEFDRSFLTLFPDIAVITSMDADHLDIYSDKNTMDDAYRTFALQVKQDGVLIYKHGLRLSSKAKHIYTYSISGKADFQSNHIEVKNNEYSFDFTFGQAKFENLTLGLPGRHNIENAIAAIAVAWQLNLDEKQIKSALASYLGVKRRFEYHIRNPEITFIDDYAHHPEELKAAILSVKELYPGKKITGIFQPHLFSRTRDFADEFAQSLSLLDELILLDIYPAREKPIPGVTSGIIFDKVTSANKILCSKEQLSEELHKLSPQVVVTLGAGDIDQLVEPVRILLEKKYKTVQS